MRPRCWRMQRGRWLPARPGCRHVLLPDPPRLRTAFGDPSLRAVRPHLLAGLAVPARGRYRRPCGSSGVGAVELGRVGVAAAGGVARFSGQVCCAILCELGPSGPNGPVLSSASELGTKRCWNMPSR